MTNDRVADALERIATALEKQTETDLLAQFAALLEGAEGVRVESQPTEPPQASNGATVLYQHPAGDRWELIAYRDKDYPSGWRIEERKGRE